MFEFAFLNVIIHFHFFLPYSPLCILLRSLFSGSIRALEERYGPAPPPNLGAAGAEAFSLWMAAVCPLSDYEKARLLKTTDTAERLRAAVGCFSTVMSRVSPAGASGTGNGNVGGAAVRTGDDDENDDEIVHAAVDDEEEVRPPRSRRSRRQPLRRPITVQVPVEVTRQTGRQSGRSTSSSPPELLISEIEGTVEGSEEMVTEEEDGNNDDEEQEQ